MTVFPLLFDVSAPTTTRTVASIVRANGVQGLDRAQVRADQATYQEVTCRSALNRVQGMPFDWTLNPYRGCTHGCHYCYARTYHEQFDLDADDQFSSIILVKTNLVDVLRQELQRPAWKRDLVAVGSATDAYQPIEGTYRLTRRSLEALADAATPAGIVTKGPMCVRDADVMQDLARRAGCTVGISVPTVDEDAWASLEPGTAHPLQRLRAVRQLRDAGLDAGVLLNPVVPGITSQPGRLERTIKAAADHGAAFIGMNVLFLEGGARDHYLAFLDREYPNLREGYRRLYQRKHASPAYRDEVKRLVKGLERKYGVAGRRRAESDEAGRPAAADSEPPRQSGFNW